MSEMDTKRVEIEELTKVHTGDANRNHVKLRETGFLGSLRWWYEAVIRGYGGTACDPTDTGCDGDNHCDACELFGCTGWSRKFRLEIEETDGIKKLKFYPLRDIDYIEWALLNKALNTISYYGAIGGKIAKSNFGLIRVQSSDIEKYKINKGSIDKYLKKKGSSVENPNLANFFFIDRPDYGKIKGLKDECKFLKGQGAKVAKRYFYKIKSGEPYRRYFTYAKDSSEFKKIKEFLDSNGIEYLEGNAVLKLEGDR